MEQVPHFDLDGRLARIPIYHLLSPLIVYNEVQYRPLWVVPACILRF
jgi:hypothetical protein